MNAIIQMLLCHGTIIPLSNGGTPLGDVSAINCTGGVSCSRANSGAAPPTFGVVTIDSSSGITYSGGPPISIAGSVISCVPASGVAGGCLTTGAQVVAGEKTFVAMLSAGAIDAGAIDAIGNMTAHATLDAQAALVCRNATYYLASGGNLFQLSANAGINLFGNADPSSVQSDVTVNSTVTRTSGPMFEVLNNGTVTLLANFDGALYAGKQGGGPSFVDFSGESGHTTLSVSEGQYVSVAGKLPTIGGYTDAGVVVYYGGAHGDSTFIASNGLDAGFIALFGNNQSHAGAASDSKAGIDWQGAWVQLYQQTLANFDPCPAVTVQAYTGPVPGAHFAGEFESAFRYASDKHAWYYCNGTAWAPVTPKAGVLTLSGGTQTTTVLSGQTCICGKVTNPSNPVGCAVSSTTLTATGTGTDQVSYICQ